MDRHERAAMIILHHLENSRSQRILWLLEELGLAYELGRPAKKPLLAMMKDHFDWLESELGRRDWFAGEAFSAADIMMSFPLEAARRRAGLDETYPNINDWLERIHARPAYADALRKGGPYAFA